MAAGGPAATASTRKVGAGGAAKTGQEEEAPTTVSEATVKEGRLGVQTAGVDDDGEVSTHAREPCEVEKQSKQALEVRAATQRRTWRRTVVGGKTTAQP